MFGFILKRLGFWFWKCYKILLRLGFKCYAGVLLGLFFIPEDGSDMVLQNFE
jgi:hypothetical protein